MIRRLTKSEGRCLGFASILLVLFTLAAFANAQGSQVQSEYRLRILEDNPSQTALSQTRAVLLQRLELLNLGAKAKLSQQGNFFVLRFDQEVDRGKVEGYLDQTGRLEFRLLKPTPLTVVPTPETIKLSDLEPPTLTNRDVASTKAELADWNGMPIVNISMTNIGAKRLALLTRKNLERFLVIVLDGKVLMVPKIVGEITGGVAQITGNFTVVETQNLARVLQSGVLPLRLELVR